MQNMKHPSTPSSNVSKGTTCVYVSTNVSSSRQASHTLGTKINKDGLSTLENKVQGIVDAPTPSNVSQLRSFLGTVNYYGNFIPNLSTRPAHLNNLLKVKTKWNWTQDCNEAFLDIKKCLSTSPVHAHFDPNERLVIACDASPYGVTAVLSHRYASGSERPIAYASRTLSPAEKNYSQNDREALAVMFGVKKFQEYVFGKTFTLVTDNKALTHIYSPSKTISNVAASRVRRWAVHLGSFSYTVEHRSASKHSNVDGLSRLPVPIKRKDKTLEADIFCAS